MLSNNNCYKEPWTRIRGQSDATVLGYTGCQRGLLAGGEFSVEMRVMGPVRSQEKSIPGGWHGKCKDCKAEMWVAGLFQDQQKGHCDQGRKRHDNGNLPFLFFSLGRSLFIYFLKKNMIQSLLIFLEVGFCFINLLFFGFNSATY